MNTFFKTFFTCLFIALAFLTYKFVSEDSYNTNLRVTKENPVFGNHESKSEKPKTENKTEKQPEVKKEQPEAKIPVEKKVEEKKTIEPKKYTHVCYFYGVNGDLVPIKREIESPVSIKSAIIVLLKGPTIAESKKGIHTDIPANVDLISIKETQKSVIVNLSSNFGNGGGSESVENRVKQLSKTVKNIEPKKYVYLYINGKEVEYLGGDGVFIKQPLE